MVFAEAPIIGRYRIDARLRQNTTGPNVLASGQVSAIRTTGLQTSRYSGAWPELLFYVRCGWHLLLFRGDGLVAWIGLLVVVQNIFSSLFNSTYSISTGMDVRARRGHCRWNGAQDRLARNGIWTAQFR